MCTASEIERVHNASRHGGSSKRLWSAKRERGANVGACQLHKRERLVVWVHGEWDMPLDEMMNAEVMR